MHDTGEAVVGALAPGLRPHSDLCCVCSAWDEAEPHPWESERERERGVLVLLCPMLPTPAAYMTSTAGVPKRTAQKRNAREWIEKDVWFRRRSGMLRAVWDFQTNTAVPLSPLCPEAQPSAPLHAHLPLPPQHYKLLISLDDLFH